MIFEIFAALDQSCPLGGSILDALAKVCQRLCDSST
jgi:hypothetical protein